MTRVHDYGSSLVVRVNVVFKNGDERFWKSDNGFRIEYDYPIVILIARDLIVSFNSQEALYMEEYLQHQSESTTTIAKGGVTVTYPRGDGTDGSWAGD